MVAFALVSTMRECFLSTMVAKPAKPRIILLATVAVMLLAGGCATGLHAYSTGRSTSHVPTLELLEDEVQGGEMREETAPAGTYVAVLENADYVFYRGSGIIERHHFRKWMAHGGIAVSKKHHGVAILYSKDPLGVFLLRRVHAPFVIRQ